MCYSFCVWLFVCDLIPFSTTSYVVCYTLVLSCACTQDEPEHVHTCMHIIYNPLSPQGLYTQEIFYTTRYTSLSSSLPYRLTLTPISLIMAEFWSWALVRGTKCGPEWYRTLQQCCTFPCIHMYYSIYLHVYTCTCVIVTFEALYICLRVDYVFF